MTLAVGGWLNSDLLFSNSWVGLLEILTASFACLVRASLKRPVISILNFTFSFLWTAILCLNQTLLSDFFSSCFRCSAPLNLADRPVSPSYTLTVSFSVHVMHCHMYPTLLVLHAILTSSELTSTNSLFVHKGHVFSSHLDFLNGFLAHKMFLTFRPPFSTILILSWLFLFSSASLSAIPS